MPRGIKSDLPSSMSTRRGAHLDSVFPRRYVANAPLYAIPNLLLMGELTLIYGPAHPDKALPAYERCLASLDAGDGESFLWLFPSHFQAQLMRRQLIRASHTRLLTGHLALDLNSFTDILYSLCPRRRPALPISAQRLLVEDVLAASAASAPYYSRRPERLSRELTQLFRRLEETGAQPSDLGGTTQRSAELQALYAAYLERLADGWSGSRERFAAVDAHLDHSTLAQRFPDLGLLVFCGFVEVPAPFLPVLDKLLSLVPESIALLDYDPEGPSFFVRTRPLYEFLRTRAVRAERSAAEQHPAAAFAGRLFTHSRDFLDAPVERVACSDRVGEVAAMARRIRQLHQEQGIELSQIRISFRNLDTYADLVAEVLPRHGLPFYLARGRPLATAPAMNTVFALIDAVLERYSRAALFRLLSSPLVRLCYEFEGHTNALSAEDFAAWTRNVPPSTGRSTWLSAIESNFAYLESELGREGEPFSEDIDDFPTRREDLRAEWEALQPLRVGLTALFDLLQPLESRQDLPSFRHHLLHALSALGVEDALTAADGRALARFLELLDELCAPAAALQPRTLSQFADLLRDAISHAHVPTATRAGIQVTDLAAAGSAPCDYLFLGGLVQGEFPRLPPADIFLEETQRRALNLDEDANTAAERLLFYRAVCAPRRGLGLFHPEQSGSETLAPSPFVDELDALLAAQPETDESNGTPGTLSRVAPRIGPRSMRGERLRPSARCPRTLQPGRTARRPHHRTAPPRARLAHRRVAHNPQESRPSRRGARRVSTARRAGYPSRRGPSFLRNPIGALRPLSLPVFCPRTAQSPASPRPGRRRLSAQARQSRPPHPLSFLCSPRRSGRTRGKFSDKHRGVAPSRPRNCRGNGTCGFFLGPRIRAPTRLRRRLGSARAFCPASFACKRLRLTPPCRPISS